MVWQFWQARNDAVHNSSIITQSSDQYDLSRTEVTKEFQQGILYLLPQEVNHHWVQGTLLELF